MKLKLLIGICLVGHGVNYAQAQNYHQDLSNAYDDYATETRRLPNPPAPIAPIHDSEIQRKLYNMDRDMYYLQQQQRNYNQDTRDSRFYQDLSNIEDRASRGLYDE